jgi:hypothetical protein
MNADGGSTDTLIVRYPCMCGCNGLTKSRYCPGDDSKLYRRLIRDSRAGVPGAAALLEFVYENNDESTFDDQREAVADYLAGPEPLAAD